MALTDENNSGIPATMLVGPANMGGYPVYANGGFGGSGGFGGDWGWIILILLLAGGGWGMGGFGGGFGNMALGYDFPWLLNGQQGINANTNAGFNQAATNAALGDISNAVTSGFGNIQASLCSGFAGVNATVNNAQNALAQQLYTNQLSDLERSFAAQTASTQGMTAIQSQLAQCCCDNRLATNDLKYTIATENCADRAALSEGIRDILTATQAQNQRILDQLCQDKIDAKNDEIAQLRQEVLFARGQASQVAQNSAIINGVYNRLNECPVGTVPVYGEQPIFRCNNNGCGCGCGNNVGGFNGTF